MRSMKAVNIPLLVLFGLCYGLGHPSLAAYRPQLVDKTLASFHEDVNRTAVSASMSVAQLFEPVEAESPGAAAGARMAKAVRAMESSLSLVTAARAETSAPRRTLAELPRRSGPGFEILTR